MAKGRGFCPECVLFDGWYASLENLKQVRDLGWLWLTRLKGNRKVTPDDRVAGPLDEVAISADGTVAPPGGLRAGPVFRIVAPDGDTEYWATNDLAMDERDAAALRRAELRDRELPPGPEAVLRGGAVPGPVGAGAAQPHRDGDAGVPAAGVAFLHHRGQWVRGQVEAGPRRGPEPTSRDPFITLPKPPTA